MAFRLHLSPDSIVPPHSLNRVSTDLAATHDLRQYLRRAVHPLHCEAEKTRGDRKPLAAGLEGE
jgi:hypothetical protein